jgi:hypothetical protein
VGGAGEVYRPWSRACGGGGSSCWNQDSMMRLNLIEHVLGLEEGELKPEVALQAVIFDCISWRLGRGELEAESRVK